MICRSQLVTEKTIMSQNNFLDDLNRELDHNGDPVYADADIRKKATEVIPFCDGRSLLAVRTGKEPFPSLTEFIVFDFMMSSIDGTDTKWQRVFHGYGYTDGLRELRHSYWGELDNGGYIFYPSASTICGAFELLKRWFDCD